MRLLSPKGIKILKTCNLYLCFIVLGMCIAVPGPCLLDLQNLVNTDTQHIAFIYTARSIGYLVGSIVGGIILDAIKSKQAVMTLCNFLVAATMLGIPWSTNLGLLTGFMVINGLCLGTTDIGGNVICLRLWGSESGPYFQALHFTFGLGGLVSPLIAAPFLGDYGGQELLSENNDNTSFSLNLTNITTEFLNSSASNATYQGIPKIVYPFSIIGAFGILVGVLFLVVAIIAPTEDSTASDENKQEGNSSYGFIFSVVILNFLLLFVEAGTEIGYAQMLTTYVVKGPLNLSSSTGSYMTSTFWAAFTVSRLASVFLAIKLSNLTLIIFDLIITSIGAAILLFLVSYEWSLWLSSIFLGVGIASFFPSAVGWLDTYVTVTNKMAAIFTVGAAFGEMVIPYTISAFIEAVPMVLVYVVPASCILSTLIFLILYMILRKRPKKEVCPKQTSATENGTVANA